MMCRNVLLLCFVFFLVSCENEEEVINITFNSVKNFESAQTVMELLDENSINYFSDMGKLAVGNNENKIQNFCSSQQYSLSARYMLQILTMIASSDSTTVIEVDDVIMFASLADFGPIGIENKKRYKYHSLKNIDRTNATAIINYEAKPRTYIQSKVQFNKEGEQWKLNFPSTLSATEKYLKLLWSQRGGSERDFIQSVIDKGGEDVQFKYKQ